MTVQGERPGRCAACPAKEDGLGRVELHHYAYEYTTAQVRANPQLALENTIWLCYCCHKVADYIRNILEDTERFNQVMVALRYRAINIKKEELYGIDIRAGKGTRGAETQ